MNKPYIKKFSDVGQFVVWLVDGNYIRATIDKEFTNFGQHYRFHFIPHNEFWIDKEHVPGEEHFFIEHLVREHYLMSQGMKYEESVSIADKAEKRERKKIDFMKAGKKPLGKCAQLELIHEKLLKEYSNHLKVWIVKGRAVRDYCFIEFTEGGHDKVYNFIPAGEVWIDDDVQVKERKFIILHELHERSLMAKGINYANAHRDASIREYYCRHHPDELELLLKEDLERNKDV